MPFLSWPELEEACNSCEKCGLSQTRRKVVVGSGRRDSPVMFIGEGPGRDEDEQGLPFVGRSGRLLDDLFTAVGWSRDEVYIANIVKCRPPDNRDPLPDEQECCIPYLRNQVYLIRPKIIVCLGRVAARRLIRDNYRITADRGRWEEKNKTLMTAMFHPAALLRDPRRLEAALDDMKAVKVKAEELANKMTCEQNEMRE